MKEKGMEKKWEIWMIRNVFCLVSNIELDVFCTHNHREKMCQLNYSFVVSSSLYVWGLLGVF